MEVMERLEEHAALIKNALIGIIAVSAVCIVVFAFVIPFAEHLSRPTFLSLNFAPGIATISINGTSYQSGVYSDLAPGDYTATLSAQGFKDKEVSFSLSSGETTTIYEYLEDPDEGLGYFERNNSDLQVLRNIDKPETKSFIERYDAKMTIKTILPLEVNYDINSLTDNPRILYSKFTIDDGTISDDCAYAFCLRIWSLSSNNDLNYRAAKAILKDNSYNIEDYHVVFAKKRS